MSLTKYEQLVSDKIAICNQRKQYHSIEREDKCIFCFTIEGCNIHPLVYKYLCGFDVIVCVNCDYNLNQPWINNHHKKYIIMAWMTEISRDILSLIFKKYILWFYYWDLKPVRFLRNLTHAS